MKQDSMTPATLIAAVNSTNAGRDPERLAMKYAKMATSPFIFLRGACHLFYEALPDTPLFRDAPLAWSCGDLHFENLGSYKGDNRLVYFDINDYDEAALAPATWDLVRLLTSIQCGADELHTTPEQSQTVAASCVAAYRAALGIGKPLWVERETASGLIQDLLTGLQNCKRVDFLNKRTVIKGHQRHLNVDGVKALAASDEQKQRVMEFMAKFAADQADPKFFKVLDIARRIAGTGSLGVERYVVLIEGKGSPDGNYLLDIKESRPSALLPHLNRLGIAQPAWPDDATRTVTVQKRMQAVDHAFLQARTLDGKPFLVKGLQATEDRVAIGDWGKKLDRLIDVASSLGRILAWDQLRASGHAGAANADQLIAFGQRSDWAADMLAMASTMNQVTSEQWAIFKNALAAGQIKAGQA